MSGLHGGERRNAMDTKSWRFRSVVGASTVAVSAAVALGVTGLGSEVFAAGANTGSAAQTSGQTSAPATQPAVTGAKKQTLLGTYVESGEGEGAAISSELPKTLDPVNKLTCPSGESCIIAVTISAQLNQSTTDTGNEFANAWTIDGEPAGAYGPYLGSTPTNGTFVVGTWTDQESVAAGKHKVQSEVYSLDGAALWAWTVTYNLYD
jgi:hypothetical protein